VEKGEQNTGAGRWDQSGADPPRPPLNAPIASPSTWSSRWWQLARSVGAAETDRFTVALSGGADSVLLLHLLASARPRADFRAVHVHHALRGEESAGDLEFCSRLCQSLGVPFTACEAPLDPATSSLEERARELRYRALLEESRRTGYTTLVTGHHADDALETLLMRLLRGTTLDGLVGIPKRGRRADVEIVRPLMGMRREEVRQLLADRGLAWREDSSNHDHRFTRNRVRESLIPSLKEVCGEEALENLRAFGRAVEGMEQSFAAKTAHLSWAPPAFAAASRSEDVSRLGGTVPRAALMSLAPTLRRRVLWRLLTEGTGKSPRRTLLFTIAIDVARGRCTRHALPGGWQLVLRAREVLLLPPAHELGSLEETPAENDAWLPFPTSQRPSSPVHRLAVPGVVRLPDGRRLTAEVVRVPEHTDPPRGPAEVELDVRYGGTPLVVRFPAAGDRFHPIGAPGSKSLRRFLADAGVPREERHRVPLVCSGSDILWVAGVRPAEACRVPGKAGQRLRLSLLGAGSGTAASA